MNDKMNYNLFQLQSKQLGFRVAKGKSRWFYYNGQQNINLREILDSEVVIEFDDTNFKGTREEFLNLSWTAVNLTAVNLYRAGYTFEIYDHEGISPHIHIRNLPITHLGKDELRIFKRTFIKHFVPAEYHQYLDNSLCGVHLIRLEYAACWKGCHSTKRLLHKFEPK